MGRIKKLFAWLRLLLLANAIISGQTKAANDFGTISIANPDNPSEGITIMDRNLGATSNNINNTASYGYKYQWGNNYGFLNGCFTEQSKGCSDSITESSKGVLDGNQYQYREGFIRNEDYNNSGYYEPIFYKVNGGPRYHWGEGNYHDGLWGGANDNPDNNRGEKQTNPEDRQGPCPDGFHIPSAGERGLLVKYWKNTYGQNITNYGTNYFYSDSSNFREFFKLPYAGYRGGNDALLYQQSYEGLYRSSSPYGTPKEYEYRDSQEGLSSDISEYARYFRLDTYYVGASNYNMRHFGLPIRCFKNTYEPTVTTDNEDIKEDNAILTNNLTKTVEFNPSKSSRKTVFNGTYTALKDNDTINYYLIDTEYDPNKNNDYLKKRCEKNKLGMTFYLYIEGELVKSTHITDACTLGQGAGFSSRIDEITMKKGEVKNVKVEIEVEGSVQEDDMYNFRLSLGKFDRDSHDLFKGEIYADFSPIKVANSIVEEYEDNNTKTATPVVTYSDGNPSEILSNGYSREMNDAYKFAYDNGITTTNNINKANMHSPLTRIAMAKMLSYYAINILGQKPDTSKGTPIFNDVTDNLNKQYNNAVTLSYQLGIMGQNMKNNNFRPNDKVTRAEFATALSRMLYGISDGNPYYASHLKKLKQEGIISNDNPTMKEKRGYVMLMLMRSVK